MSLAFPVESFVRSSQSTNSSSVSGTNSEPVGTNTELSSPCIVEMVSADFRNVSSLVKSLVDVVDVSENKPLSRMDNLRVAAFCGALRS